MVKLNPLSILLTVLVLNVSCNKKDIKQSSTWYINGQAFSSNNVILYEDRGGSALFVMQGNHENNVDTNSGFYLHTGSGAFPSSGTLPLYNGPPSNNPALLRLSIYNNKVEYQLSKYSEVSILISGNAGQRKFELPEVWFTNTGSAQDSVLVKGVFSEP